MGANADGKSEPWDSPRAVAHCATGALCQAQRELDPEYGAVGFSPALKLMAIAATGNAPGHYTLDRISNWNDTPGRTADEVAAKLHLAATSSAVRPGVSFQLLIRSSV